MTMPSNTHPRHDGVYSPDADASGPNGRGDDMTKRVARGAHETIDRLAETAAPQVERLQVALTDAGQTVRAQAHHVREVGDEWTESLRSSVRNHPLAAVATAFALGALIFRFTR